MAKLTRREMHLLKLIYPEGTLAVGLSASAELCRRGYMVRGKKDRYVLTRKGIIAVVASQRQPQRTAST